MRIDSHQHFWQVERGDYGWITPELPTLYRDFLPETLEVHLDQHRFNGSIVVQAAATVAESEFILKLAAHHDRILGVVAWLDLEDPEYPTVLARYLTHPKFVGVRVMIQSMEDSDIILHSPYIEAIRDLADRNIPVDLLMKANQLASVAALLHSVPHLHAVIDHIGKPEIASGVFTPWSDFIAIIASYPNVYCKLSGMVTEADHDSWKIEQFTPYIRHVLDCFGPKRILFGSDWPVCLLAASYDEVIGLADVAAAYLSSEEQKALFYGGNAAVFYRLMG
ncbi:MAG: amidohydrolase family protein [Gorillibacterium sp.]|nr:amidohydrolase family protein [Gorillibacterium sp.]